MLLKEPIGGIPSWLFWYNIAGTWAIYGKTTVSTVIKWCSSRPKKDRFSLVGKWFFNKEV